MAAEYSAQNYNQPNNQLSFYRTQQQPSPVDSMPPTPNNVSPTSPRMETYLKYQLPNQVKQLRPPKSPLYVPAVLRPTERPPRPSPMTPPKSLHGSLDSLQEEGFDERMAADGRLPFDLATQGLIVEEELGDVTGPPKKDHWKPDEASPSCDSPKCRSSFNLFVRKHHCRHCGHIFCSEHTAFTIPLDQDARFHPEGVQSKACDSCYRQYQKWDTARSIHRKTSENSEDGDSQSGSSTPLASQGNSRPPPHDPRRMIAHAMGSQRAESVASSVPKDWAWSTF